VRCRGSHIVQTVRSQIAVRLSALHSGHALPTEINRLQAVTGLVNPGAMVRLEALGALKKKITPSGIEPGDLPVL
jgi:hypothetical protein